MKRMLEEYGQVVLMALCGAGVLFYTMSPWIALGLA